MSTWRASRLPRPLDSQPHYGAHLGDVAYWSPYVHDVLGRHGLESATIEAPFVGSFPTFLVGDVVVKLFGAFLDGGRSFAVERSMHQLLAGYPEIPAPRLVATGELFEASTGWPWPYLVTERLEGKAVRDVDLSGGVGEEVAVHLGEWTALLHRLVPPPAVLERDLLPELRASAPARLAGYGLPSHLVDQVPEYLADAPDLRVLVHADITEDHAFVHGGRLVGVIDWGDSLAADPWYELVPVYFDSLRGRRDLFELFLRSYGWPVDDDFPRRALQAVLEFQFNAIGRIGELVDIESVRTLDELAALLFPRSV